jgi:UDP-glucose 4,6-dehydratase
MILLIGSSGYIGKEFVSQLVKNQINFVTLSYKDCNENNLTSLIKNKKINYIINSAAFVGKPNIEACESQKDKCISGNILLPILIKNVCEKHNIIYCHISTGCLYNGDSNSEKGFSENDEPNFTFEQNNCGFYTGTKALAEKEIKEYSKSYIWRIRLPFENVNNDRNYISKVINYNTLIIEKNSLSNKKEFVSACIESIKKQIPFGIYNITNSGSISAVDVVKKIIDTIIPDKKANFICMEEFYKTISSMPRSNCITDNSKILSCGIKLSEVNESLDKCLKEWVW